MKSVVFAAGEGTRLNPLTSTRPKHLLPLAGKPLLIHIIQEIASAGIEEIGIVVHHYKEKIINILGDGSIFNVKIRYIYQDKLDGTASALEVSKNFVGNNDVLVVYGDVTATRDIIEGAINLFKEKNPDCVIVGVEVKNPEEYGVLLVENGRLKCIVEKPKKEEVTSNLINAGIYVFSPAIFKTLNKIGYSPRGERELTDAITMLSKKGSVLVFDGGGGWWFDIGRPWDYLDANRFFLKKIRRSVKGYVKGYLEGEVFVGENAVIMPGAVILGPSYIGSNSVIGPNSVVGPYTYIGKGVSIGSLTSISSSIIMDYSEIGSGTIIDESIIGEKVKIGNNVLIKSTVSSDETIKTIIKNRIIDSRRKRLGAIIGDRCVIDDRVILYPGTSIQNDTIWRESNIFHLG